MIIGLQAIDLADNITSRDFNFKLSTLGTVIISYLERERNGVKQGDWFYRCILSQKPSSGNQASEYSFP
jgi:hypothetical protein